MCSSTHACDSHTRVLPQDIWSALPLSSSRAVETDGPLLQQLMDWKAASRAPSSVNVSRIAEAVGSLGEGLCLWVIVVLFLWVCKELGCALWFG